MLVSYFYTLDFVTGFQFDYVFDWTILKYQQSQLATPPTRALVISVLCFTLSFISIYAFVLTSCLI